MSNFDPSKKPARTYEWLIVQIHLQFVGPVDKRYHGYNAFFWTTSDRIAFNSEFKTFLTDTTLNK